MKLNKNKAFTLVELIVVITILAILGTIGFISLQGFQKDARDSVRISDIKSIEKGLELNMLKDGSYLMPEDYTTITASGNIIRYQGLAGSKVMGNIGVTGGGVDPKTGDYYDYILGGNKRSYQIVGYFENDNQVSLGINNNVFAYSYTGGYIRTFGQKLGLIKKNGKSIHLTNTGTIDIRNTSGQEYEVIFSPTDSITSNSGQVLFTNIYNRDINLLNRKELAKLDKSLMLYFDMKTINNDGRLIDFSKNNSTGFCKHNIGGIYSDVNFKLVGCGINGGLQMNADGVVFDGVGDIIEVTDFGLGAYNWSIEFMGRIDEVGEDTMVIYNGEERGLHENNRYVLAHPRSAGFDQWLNFNIVDNEIGLVLAESANTGERTKSLDYNITERKDSFYHIVVQRTESKVIFYINGELIGKVDDTQVNAAWNGNWLIGSRITGQMPFKGVIKSFRVFDRLLTENEIKAIYSSTLED